MGWVVMKYEGSNCPVLFIVIVDPQDNIISDYPAIRGNERDLVDFSIVKMKNTTYTAMAIFYGKVSPPAIVDKLRLYVSMYYGTANVLYTYIMSNVGYEHDRYWLDLQYNWHGINKLLNIGWYGIL